MAIFWNFEKSNVSVEFYCSKCEQNTLHRIDQGRRGPCLKCLKRLDRENQERLNHASIAWKQQKLFFDPLD
jgi:ribosomal protein L44E